ncbi:Methyltransferase [Pleurostoma richardsiae]|uniref:Methyltransferase n=1 Tax=Pleurostoma richardsiae TaxID=41990 RepID=A0AA38S4Y8_9PEZI|nr:Methyltransferase [Pleurostoma richardsiae]
MAILQSASEAFWGLLHPWIFMSVSLSFLPGTLLRLLRARQLLAHLLPSPSRLRDAWFGDFWSAVGPQVREMGEDRVVPLLEGRVHRGQALEDPAVVRGVNGAEPGLRGTVLEIGAGSGMWVGLLGKFVDPRLRKAEGPAAAAANPTTPGGGSTNGERAAAEDRETALEEAMELRQRRGLEGGQLGGGGSSPHTVTRILGVEPNAGHHAELRRRVVEAGLDGVYEIVPVGIEDLAASGKVERGSVDCIVSILCLCSIPEPRRHITELYGYLKPGGKWYVYEHVKCSNSWAMVLYQAIVELFWPHLIGGCHLQRETGKWLREAGPWTSVDLAQPVQEPWWHCVPHITGTLTK